MRGTMRLHHRSARVWATAALVWVLLPSTIRLGWWVPLHLVLAGLMLSLGGLRGLTGPIAGAAGIAFAWAAAAIAVAKAWVFPSLARLPRVRAQSLAWWAGIEVTDRTNIDACRDRKGSLAPGGALS